MMLTKKVLYQVHCPCGNDFEKAFEIQSGSEKVSTEAQAFCPHCGEYVTVTVQGKIKPDADLLREIEARKPAK